MEPGSSPSSAASSSPLLSQGSFSCKHGSDFWLFDYNSGNPAFCGLCRLIELWEDEVPRRIHAYKLLAENGNPEVAPQFWAHYQASLGLNPPKPDQNLREYCLARGQLYGKPPSKANYPLLAALWSMMGKQPKLARAVLGALRSQPIIVTAAEIGLSPYGTHEALVKGIRMAFREIRSYRSR